MTPKKPFGYGKRQLFCEELPLRKVIQEVGSPTYVYSANYFRSQLKTLQSELGDIPAVICFAVKANSNLSILSLMVEGGAGLDLVSGGERRSRRVGCPAERLVFSGVGKTRQEMAQGLQYQSKGIRSFHVESIAELATLSEVAETLGKRAQVTLRFNPDVDAKTHPYISTGLKKNKFGLTHDEVLGIAKSLDGFPMIDLCGLSIHIGSQILDLAPLSEAFEKCVEMVHQLNTHLPIPLRWADFGGGLGVAYQGERAPSIREYARVIKKSYKKLPLFNKQRGTPMELFLEPGRVLSAQGGALITQILYRKSRAKKDFLIVDAAMNDLMRPSLYGSYHEVAPLNSASRGKIPASLRKSK